MIFSWDYTLSVWNRAALKRCSSASLDKKVKEKEEEEVEEEVSGSSRGGVLEV